MRIVRAISLVNRCVKIRVCKHRCDVTSVNFDWLSVVRCAF